MKGIFGGMFDLDYDGTISSMESAMEFAFWDGLLNDISEIKTELELSGVDSDERWEVLGNAGLDPDEYDF